MGELLANVAIALSIGVISLNGFKGKPGMIVMGSLLFHPLWFIGGIRLGKPSSVWARFCYGQKRMTEARGRFRREPPSWMATRPTSAPDELRYACGVFVAAWLVMVVSGLPASAIAGVLIPVLVLTWRGWSAGRVTLIVLGGVAAASTLGFGFLFPDDGTINYIRPGGLIGVVWAEAALTVLTIAGGVLLYRPTVRAYFQAVVTRPPADAGPWAYNVTV
jgi:hypothetical protein